MVPPNVFPPPGQARIHPAIAQCSAVQSDEIVPNNQVSGDGAKAGRRFRRGKSSVCSGRPHSTRSTPALKSAPSFGEFGPGLSAAMLKGVEAAKRGCSSDPSRSGSKDPRPPEIVSRGKQFKPWFGLDVRAWLFCSWREMPFVLLSSPTVLATTRSSCARAHRVLGLSPTRCAPG